MVNFRQPYLAQSLQDFWRRWHISLSTWLRDYLYIPLGGNRKGKLRTYLNLMTTMLLGGLWHGANWTFVIWGALHGLYLVLQRLLGPPLMAVARSLRLPDGLTTFMARCLVFVLVGVAWVFFRAPDVRTAMQILVHALTSDYSAARVPDTFQVVKGLGLIAVLMTAEIALAQPRLRPLVREHDALRFGASLAMVWLLALAGAFNGQQFIYFAF
jgi:D-alanyl-lipoteichoic acid acyltransferase DltB (MBOAT superfamily)